MLQLVICIYNLKPQSNYGCEINVVEYKVNTIHKLITSTSNVYFKGKCADVQPPLRNCRRLFTIDGDRLWKAFCPLRLICTACPSCIGWRGGGVLGGHKQRRALAAFCLLHRHMTFLVPFACIANEFIFYRQKRHPKTRVQNLFSPNQSCRLLEPWRGEPRCVTEFI